MDKIQLTILELIYQISFFKNFFLIFFLNGISMNLYTKNEIKIVKNK